MHSLTLRHSFSNIRVFNNLWLVQNDKWTLTADLTPTTYELTPDHQGRVKYQNSLLFGNQERRFIEARKALRCSLR